MATTTNYFFQQAGSYIANGTVAPTATQANFFNTLKCQVVAADADTTATLTHNWNLSAAAQANFEPLINMYLQVAGTAYPIASFSISTNAVTLTKSTAAGGGGTYIVILQRPHSQMD